MKNPAVGSRQPRSPRPRVACNRFAYWGRGRGAVSLPLPHSQPPPLTEEGLAASSSGLLDHLQSPREECGYSIRAHTGDIWGIPVERSVPLGGKVEEVASGLHLQQSPLLVGFAECSQGKQNVGSRRGCRNKELCMGQHHCGNPQEPASARRGGGGSWKGSA